MTDDQVEHDVTLVPAGGKFTGHYGPHRPTCTCGWEGEVKNRTAAKADADAHLGIKPTPITGPGDGVGYIPPTTPDDPGYPSLSEQKERP